MSVRRPELPPGAAEALAMLDGSEVLGASRQLSIAADLFVALAQEYEGSSEGLVRSLHQVAGYLIARRGESSQAIPNALRLMLAGLDEDAHVPLEETRERVIRTVRAYDASARAWMESLIATGANLIANGDRVLVYDYSSSVAGILRAVHTRGQPVVVVVPEARSLDGGRKYLMDLQDTALAFEVIPDAAVASAIQRCRLALSGAETLSAQGGCYNTIGTLAAAIAARYWRVPFYVASTLIKIDSGTVYGRERSIPSRELHGLVSGWNLSETCSVRTDYPDLDYTPPDLITGLITELGVLPPAALSQHARRFVDGKEGR